MHPSGAYLSSRKPGRTCSRSSVHCYLTAARVRSTFHSRESSMSPLPVLTKLAAMLRNIPAVQLVFAKFAALLRRKEIGEPRARELLREASGLTRSTVDQHAAVLHPRSDHGLAAPETNDQSERDKLIRRR